MRRCTTARSAVRLLGDALPGALPVPRGVLLSARRRWRLHCPQLRGRPQLRRVLRWVRRHASMWRVCGAEDLQRERLRLRWSDRAGAVQRCRLRMRSPHPERQLRRPAHPRVRKLSGGSSVLCDVQLRALRSRDGFRVLHAQRGELRSAERARQLRHAPHRFMRVVPGLRGRRRRLLPGPWAAVLLRL